MKIKVSVPATSANVGSGFDALGLAVTLYNTVTFEESDKLDISAADGTRPATPCWNAPVTTTRRWPTRTH